MTREQIIDIFKYAEKCYAGILPIEADKYIAGDDSMYDKIPKCGHDFAFPQEIIAELDGQNSDTAVRCLRAIAAMRRSGIAGSAFHDELDYAKKLGFTLGEILDSQKSGISDYFSSYYISVAERIKKMYADEIKSVITPDYLTMRLKDAAYNNGINILLILTADVYTEYPSDELREQILIYLKKFGPKASIELLTRLYDKHDDFKETFKRFVNNFENAKMLYAVLNFNISETEKIMRYIELGDFFVVCASLKIFGEKNQRIGLSFVNNEPEKYLPMLIDPAHIGERICTACEIIVKYKNLQIFPELISELSKYYSKMISIMDGAIYITDENGKRIADSGMAIRHLIASDKENAVKKIEVCRNFADFGYRMNMIRAFILLSPFDSGAKDIADIILKVLVMRGYKNCFADYYGIYLSARSFLGVSPDEATNELLNMGVSREMIYYAPFVFIDERYLHDKPIYSTEVAASSAKLAAAHPDEALKFFESIVKNPEQAVFFVNNLYENGGCTNTELPIKLLSFKQKTALKTAASIIAPNEELFRTPLEKALPKLKGDGLKKANEIIKKWDNDRKYGADFKFTSNETVEEFVRDNADTSSDKLMEFIPEEYYKNVRYKDLSGTASEDAIKYIIRGYMALSEPTVLNDCTRVAEMLYSPDLNDVLENIFQLWLETGADTKKKMLLLPYYIYGSDTRIMSAKKQLTAWAEASRGALAAFAVNAIALNGGSAALLLVNDTAAKFPNNMVKKAAKAAFELAAKELGVTEDALADKIVPTLGFDENGEQILDFGSRTFTLSLMPDLTISITDNDKEKVIKSLPKPNSSDNENKAAEAKQKLTDIKKQLKSVVSIQKSRLETVLRNGRTWNTDAWKKLFADNPIMHRFAGGLVWGIYSGGKELLHTFRYADDGTFTDENDDEFILPENGNISLVHPIELSKETLEKWLTQFSDYEITEPIPQLSAHIYTLSESDISEDFRITKYDGKSALAGTLSGAYKKYNLARASVEDAGGFAGYHLIDKVLGLGFAMDFEMLYVGQEPDDSADVQEIYFYILPENEEKPNSYEEYSPVDPRAISPRFVSSALDILERVINK